METTLNEGPIIGMLFCFLASIVYAMSAGNTTATLRNIDPLVPEQVQMFGKLAHINSTRFVIALTGGISCLYIPFKVGTYDGVWAGVITFFVYNFMAIVIGNVFWRFGLLPLNYLLAIISGPLGVFLCLFELKLLK